MDNPKISVIVPVYEVEYYLPFCVVPSIANSLKNLKSVR